MKLAKKIDLIAHVIRIIFCNYLSSRSLNPSFKIYLRIVIQSLREDTKLFIVRNVKRVEKVEKI